MALENKKDLFNLVCVGRVALTRRHIHHAQREAAGRYDVGIAVLTRASSSDKAMLRPAIAFEFCVLKSVPIRDAIVKARRIALGNLFQGELGDFRWLLMKGLLRRDTPRFYTRLRGVASCCGRRTSKRRGVPSGFVERKSIFLPRFIAGNKRFAILNSCSWPGENGYPCLLCLHHEKHLITDSV